MPLRNLWDILRKCSLLRDLFALLRRIPLARLISAAGPLTLFWPGRASAAPPEGTSAVAAGPNEAAAAPAVANVDHPPVTGVTVRGAAAPSRALRGAFPVR